MRKLSLVHSVSIHILYVYARTVGKHNVNFQWQRRQLQCHTVRTVMIKCSISYAYLELEELAMLAKLKRHPPTVL